MNTKQQEDSSMSKEEVELLNKLMTDKTLNPTSKEELQTTRIPKDDSKFQQLQKALDDCSKKAHTFLYSSISLGASVPMVLIFKTMKPLYILPLVGGAVDLYKSSQNCKNEREAFDTYLLKRRKWELLSEAKRLEMEKNALQDELQKRRQSK
ncbi:predicted protein [Naegleria gruberi]|uniref:Predicted protein n=1 Tax=Naegleria gruberi TaxID=5762 RepID=D2VUM3_NAEGR|nr:uncharacterized protein NAEGRDRAFT_72714 [Naegleria gruberi]EFC39476.1 predicted protein [Naegleria gruberi]|eukprot:XP_002672220.1 predicted protein [Naegleria gruberi strain NEG-M]